MNTFVKSHGLGNSYIVLDEEKINFKLSEKLIQKICSSEYGIGSDGILLKVSSSKADFGVRIFNPDGSEAEKSGNGIRIFGKYLFDHKYTIKKSFNLETLGGIVVLEILEQEKEIASLLRVEMGKAVFDPRFIPVVLKEETVLNHPFEFFDQIFEINCVSTGNPHCVIFRDSLDTEEILKYGPIIENHPLFPSKINVQFAKLIDNRTVDILIWERGAGYTTASGSSSCAVAAVARKLGKLGNKATINMPGGKLFIDISDDWDINLTGPVEEICKGTLSDKLLK